MHYDVTPMSDDGMKMYDDLPACQAVVLSWLNAGSNPIWHARMKVEVRLAMPLLAYSLDRLANETPKG